MQTYHTWILMGLFHGLPGWHQNISKPPGGHLVFQLPNMSSEKAFRGTPNVQNKITHQLRLEDFGWRLMFVDMRLTNHTWMSWLCTFILGFAFVADVSNLLNMGVSLIHHLQSSYLSEICLRKKHRNMVSNDGFSWWFSMVESKTSP